jgi:transposase-like protein
MVKQTTQDKESSNIIWNNLEAMVRLRVREFIQNLLEAEIEDLLGRQKSERRQIADSSTAYRNGYGKERKLTLGCGTIKLRRPRVRG